ncbi:MAG: hypothetical protein ACRCVY_01465 [Commensalibacter sp.]
MISLRLTSTQLSAIADWFLPNHFGYSQGVAVEPWQGGFQKP